MSAAVSQVPADELSVSAADRVMDNQALYDTWASTYDTDGNVLQAVDDFELQHLLPRFTQLVDEQARHSGQKALHILDYGCGTGRATLKLVQAQWEHPVQLEAWDGSGGMVEVARGKCAAAAPAGSSNKVDLSFDVLDFSSLDNIRADAVGSFDAAISTLVLEHIPTAAYFSTLAALLKPGGYALVTNMHDGMGSTTRAGYKTDEGERVKGVSYVHTVSGSANAAKKAGFEVVKVPSSSGVVGDGLLETAVSAEMVENGTVSKRGGKWVGVKIWYGMLLRKT